MDTAASQPELDGAVVVGVDGSDDGSAALEWASRQAAVDHRALVLLHAADAPAIYAHASVPGSSFDPTGLVDDAIEAGHRLCREARERVVSRRPGAAVTTCVGSEDPRQALLHASERASLVVLGSRGRGPVASLLLGSVSIAVSRHASCPLVVVRPDQQDTPDLPVVAAVDAGPGSRPVLEFAFRHASTHARPLTVLHTRPDLLAMIYGLGELTPPVDIEDANLSLAEALAGFAEKFPDVPVHRELRGELTLDALLQLAEGASLVVVGRRHPAGLRGALHAGLATPVLEKSPCPVAVVPAG